MKGKKPKTHFVCQVCGHQALRWQGQCVCGAWNSLVEELVVEKAEFLGTTSSDRDPLPITDVLSGAYARFDTGDAELNRVLGGGLVKGSLVLISGDPGIGKSTLLLQVATRWPAIMGPFCTFPARNRKNRSKCGRNGWE
ncbi:MAG: AAA family ATPase [Bacillota bacterium]